MRGRFLKGRCWSDVTSGELQSIDGYMNLALEKCEEHVDGVKKRSYGDAFVRGNNGRIYDSEGVFCANTSSDVHLCRLRASNTRTTTHAFYRSLGGIGY